MSNTWTGLGIGTKDSKGEWLEMFFSEEKISSSDINSSFVLTLLTFLKIVCF